MLFKFIYNILDIMYYSRLMKDQGTADAETDGNSQILDILSDVYNQVVPVPGEILRIVNSKVRMPFPEEEYQQISMYTGETIFHYFSERKFLWILCSILCENKVLFICKDMRKLTAVVLQVIAILNPLRYQSSIIPILPDKMVNILEPPCPFLAGMTNPAPLKKIERPEDLIVLDLDDVNTSDSIPENPIVPDLPNQKRLLETLSYFYPKKSNTYRPKPDVEKPQITPLFAQLNSYIASLLTIEKCCITDLTRDVTVFWTDNFLEEQAPESIPFYKLFIITQMFQTFTDRYLRDYDKKRRIEKSPTPSRSPLKSRESSCLPTINLKQPEEQPRTSQETQGSKQPDRN